jgi:transcriptional regulator GlxA family with amidase domain
MWHTLETDIRTRCAARNGWISSRSGVCVNDVRFRNRALRAANQLAGRTLYRWWHAAPGDKPAVASNGIAVLPDFAFGSDESPPPTS